MPRSRISSVIKTSGALRQILHDAFDERCLAATWTACEQNFLVHITAHASGNARKTTQYWCNDVALK